MNPLLHSLRQSEVEEISLVLISQSIPFHVEESTDGFAIYVPSAYLDRARTHVGEYSDEAVRAETSDDVDAYRFSHGIPLGIIAILISIHFWRTNLPPYIDIEGTFSNTKSIIEYGQLYRLITSLFLHVDIRHLMGNCVALWLFGAPVCGRFGNGVGSFLMLYCGIFGNLFSVVLRDDSIHSMGASTAVFAGLGLLVGIRISGKHGNGKTVNAWLALGAGLALLGFLGTGERSDLFAHLGGFIFGLTAGCIHHFIFSNAPSALVQRICGFLSITTVFTAWLKLLRI